MSLLKTGAATLLFSLALWACSPPAPEPTRHVPTASPTPSPTATVATATPTASPTPMAVTPIPTATPTATASPTPTPTLAVVGEHGGALAAVASADVSHRDVHRSLSPTLAARGPGVAYSRLLRLRTGVDITQPSLLLECDLCRGWDMENPSVYRLRLRDDARWQDLPPVNGRRLTAEDVAFSLERQREEDSPIAPLLRALDAVSVEDDLTLKLTLNFPDADFLLALADGRAKVVAREAVESEGGLRDGPVVGTGPWIWLGTERGAGSEFEANPGYFEEGLPFASRLSFKVIKDPDIRIAAFLTGSIDVYDPSPQEWAKLRASSATNGAFLSKEGGVGMVLAMNAGRPPFDDASVRRAVFGSLNPWDYLDEVWGGQGFITAGAPVVEASWLLGRDELGAFLQPGEEAPEVGFEMLVADFGDPSLELGRRIEGELREAGFAPDLKVLTPVEYSERVWQERDYQLFIGPVPPASGPNSYLFSVLHSGGQWNILSHGDAALDRLIESQQALPFDAPERGDALRAIQNRLMEQAYMLGLGANGTRWLTQDGVRGFYPNAALAEGFFWAKTWLDR